ncbi:hypothetical protein ABZX92_18975 [Lentzea sp. NPDC006480]|uniref:hypothetical protein n=1 Tax=Lentzea sp. NPDC006480 TaxID=3157176 RepID=UPI0033A31FCF
MAADTWTTIAAFTAAGLSVINVAATGILNNRVQLSQWRRSKEIEIFGDFAQAVNHYLEACNNLASSMDQLGDINHRSQPPDANETSDLHEQIAVAHSKMDSEFAKVMQKLSELEVVAGITVITEAQEVALTLRSAIYSLRPGGPQFKMEQYHRISKDVAERMARFTRAVRVEIGTESRIRFWGKKVERSSERIYGI